MFIKDDICYADKQGNGIKVVEAKPLSNKKMLITFSNCESRIFDVSLIQGAAFTILDDEDVFRNPKIFHGVITWDEGKLDIAPEAVYEMSYMPDEDYEVNNDLYNIAEEVDDKLK